MNKNAELWIRALESNNYIQGPKYLHYADTFCVLGVGCDVFMKVTNGEPWVHGLIGYIYMDRTTRLPETVQKWLGLKTDWGHPNPVRDGDRMFQDLVNLNDSGVSFVEIAKILRENDNRYFLAENKEEEMV